MKLTGNQSKSRWIVLALLFTLHSSLFANHVAAQTFTRRIQQTQQGEGTLRIHHDDAIDALVNGPKQPEKPVPAEKKQEKKDERQQQEAQKPVPAQRDKVQPDEQPTDSVGQKKRTRKAMGFRIQVFAGGSTRQDRLKAEHTRSTLRQLFPDETAYVHYAKPRWLCRIGDFTVRDEAEQMLVEVRKAGYPTATIVRDKVNVPY